MKRLIALFVLLSTIICIFTIPANAKSDTKTKSITMHLTNEGRGNEVTCTIPFYSKWKTSENVVYGQETYLKTPKGNEITIWILRADEDPEAEICCKYLSKKKYKKEFMEFLQAGLDDPTMDASSIYKIIKDGHGKYMLTVDFEDQYGVIRLLDADHVMLYRIETNGEKVTKSVKKKLIAYSKQAVLEKKTTGIDTEPKTDPEPEVNREPDLNVEILNVELDAERLIFSSVYSNMAWGYQKRAVYIFGDGKVYTFDFAKDSGNLEGDISEENVLKYVKKTEPAAVIDKDYLLEIYSYAVHIDPEATYTTEHVMCDYGQKNLYFYNENGDKVLCASDGDVRYTINDRYAQEVEKLWNGIYLHYKEK